jgi:hypothetical protein
VHEFQEVTGILKPIPVSKTCTKCKQAKNETTDFYKHPKGINGYSPWCKACQREQNKLCHKLFNERNPGYFTEYYRAVKDKVIAGYGGKCACCGVIERIFLTLDHVNGGGRKERVVCGNNKAYMDALRRNFPPDYQVLCFNCNWAKHALGECPHQTK